MGTQNSELNRNYILGAVIAELSCVARVCVCVGVSSANASVDLTDRALASMEDISVYPEGMTA